jgi:plasmid stabilization system protein ParE
MALLAYSKQASLDLARIWLWIAQSSGEAQADGILDKITKRIASLERFPKLGPPLPALDETARKLVIMRWIVICSAYGTM